MGRADAACGKDVVILHAQGIDGAADRVRRVGDDPSLGQADTERVQRVAQVRHVGIFGAPGQDFIADDNQRGGDGFGGTI